MAQAIETALKIGAYTYLYKLFQIEGLLQVVDEIRRQELRRTLAQ